MMADFDFRKPRGMDGEWPVTMTGIGLAERSRKPERNGVGRTLPFTDDGEVERGLGNAR